MLVYETLCPAVRGQPAWDICKWEVVLWVKVLEVSMYGQMELDGVWGIPSHALAASLLLAAPRPGAGRWSLPGAFGIGRGGAGSVN